MAAPSPHPAIRSTTIFCVFLVYSVVVQYVLVCLLRFMYGMDVELDKVKTVDFSTVN